MKDIKRYSPVQFKASPKETESRDNWDVVLKYAGEAEGATHITDLSHRLRLDLQSADLGAKQPFGIGVPEVPGQSVLANGLLVNRMNGTQTSIYHLEGVGPKMPEETEYTDVTENTLFVAIYGKDVFRICEKLSNLDFMDPEKTAPFLYQGPFSHVPCQIVTVCRDGEKSGVVLTCSRGYGRDMIHAILHAGEEFGLKPAGETRFTEWISSM
ncbi:MAG: sarcosine oxidase subunit gamma SoxG [Desulfobacter sp.]|nr:MAG: sarcosine oxidase subunit gamma SoxG [Desulfobacter sp.]